MRYVCACLFDQKEPAESPMRIIDEAPSVPPSLSPPPRLGACRSNAPYEEFLSAHQGAALIHKKSGIASTNTRYVMSVRQNAHTSARNEQWGKLAPQHSLSASKAP